jgi:hypothetical protein
LFMFAYVYRAELKYINYVCARTTGSNVTATPLLSKLSFIFSFSEFWQTFFLR